MPELRTGCGLLRGFVVITKSEASSQRHQDDLSVHWEESERRLEQQWQNRPSMDNFISN